MRRYECEIQITETWAVTVDAESPEEAMEIAEDLDAEEIKSQGDFEQDRIDCYVLPVEVYDD